jgi:hypothetical protein
VKLILKIARLPSFHHMTPAQTQQVIEYNKEKDAKLELLVQLLTADGKI